MNILMQQLKGAKNELEKKIRKIATENLLLSKMDEHYQQQQEEMLFQKQCLLRALDVLLQKERILLKDQQELIAEHQQLKMELERLQHSVDTTEGKAELLLNSWRERRNMMTLLIYVRALDNRQNIPPIHDLRVHDVVLGYRQDRCYFIVDEYGRKQIISDELGQEMADCPWFVKTNKQVYLNMLHCTGELHKIGEVSQNKHVVLDAQTRERMESNIAATELDNLLNASRRLATEFSTFWGNTRFTLDETGLFVAFRPSHRGKN